MRLLSKVMRAELVRETEEGVAGNLPEEMRRPAWLQRTELQYIERNCSTSAKEIRVHIFMHVCMDVCMLLL